MIEPQKFEQLPTNIVRLMNQLQSWVINNIAKRIAANADLSATAAHKLNRLMTLRTFDVDYQKEIAKFTGLAEKEIERIIKDAAQAMHAYDKQIYNKKGIPFTPFEENAFMQNLTSAITEVTQEEARNITRTLGFAEKKGATTATKPVQRFFQDELDSTLLKVRTGAQDYNSAINDMVRKMTKSGVRTVDYASGHADKIDVAIRRALMTGLKKLSHEHERQRAAELGLTTFEISWHAAHRPSHGWGGRRYTTVPIDDIDPQTGKKYLLMEELFEKYGGGTLDDINCYHDIFYIYPDSLPVYSEEDLKRMEASELEKIEYNGKEYNKYEAREKQRQFERAMRKERLDAEAYAAAGLADEYGASRGKYMRLRKEYKEFCDAAGLKTEFERVYYDGRGRITANVLQNGYTGGIIKTDKQFGKKIGKHAADYGLNPSNASDRQKMHGIVDNIVSERDTVLTGGWRGQKDNVLFHVKGEDVVVTKQDKEFITILKGGIDNKRVKNAREREV